jgi:tetratricopeptide (TPR) repeat protein
MRQHTLDYLGLIEGTGKSSVEMDYLRHYERILGGFRDQPIQFMEIGVADGSSLRMWEKFLPQATIIGIDTQPNCVRYAGGRIVVEIGSQADPLFLSTLKEKYQPTVIVDDGSHMSEHVFVTLEHLFPCLPPGGIYIIEDVHLHYGGNAAFWHSGGGVTPTDYVAATARRLTSLHLDTECSDAASAFAKEIDRVEFIPGAVVIHKARVNDILDHLGDLFEAAELANHYLTWFHLTRVLSNHGDFERAEIAAQRSVALSPERAAVWIRLGYVQEQRGKLPEAIEAMREGIKLDPKDSSLPSALARLEAKVGRPDAGP